MIQVVGRCRFIITYYVCSITGSSWPYCPQMRPLPNFETYSFLNVVYCNRFFLIFLLFFYLMKWDPFSPNGNPSHTSDLSNCWKVVVWVVFFFPSIWYWLKWNLVSPDGIHLILGCLIMKTCISHLLFPNLFFDFIYVSGNETVFSKWD